MNRKLLIGSIVSAVLILAATTAAEVSVTVYNSNLGVIRDTRELEFVKGSGKISFQDVASQIDPTSVGFELVDKGRAVTILEQNYAYDLVSPEKIYQKYIDKGIDVVDKQGNIYRGTLLTASGGSIVLKEDSGKIKVILTSQIVNVNFPDLPEGLITRPTLFWLYNSNFDGRARCHVSYQTTGIGWNAEYVAILSEDEKSLGLTGWASINNQSGATYDDATLKLIAGDIHRAQAPRRDMRLAMPKAADMVMAEGAGFEEKEFFEYHMYTLPRRATIADREIKQITLFDPAATEVTKEYFYEPDSNPAKVRVELNFINSKAAGLGLPLPAGRTRVFKADSDGSMVLLGEDRIDHTPRDEKVKLTIGYAFDIVGEHKVTDIERISSRVEETSFAIEVRNRKKEDISVKVIKSLYGDWDILSTNIEYTKKDAGTVEFVLPVKANSKTELNFKVRFNH